MMSYIPCADPDLDEKTADDVEMVILPRTGDIGNFEVHRALPFKDKRMVGPFIFWDQMGPGEFLTGEGVDVRPHPHIGLSTVTYLFEGTMDHKDSLGNDMRIKPGEVNLMTAGRGIVHSERTGEDVRKAPSSLFGIQSWIAQPKAYEQSDPAFAHVDEADLPVFGDKGIKGRVILGDFAGVQSPTPLQWDTLYVDLHLQEGSSIEVPTTTEERALYIVRGQVEMGGVTYDQQQMLVLTPNNHVMIRAKSDVHMMVLGGATMDGPRHIWWNFVASDKELLEQAKKDWKAGAFPSVPKDDKEFIPLPEA